MKKLIIAAALIAFASSANAAEKRLKPIIPPGEREAADPFAYYPQAYKDNQYGQAAEPPVNTLVSDAPHEPNEVFDADDRGNLYIK